MRTNFIKVKLIIFLSATFLFIGCSAAEDAPTFAVDGCGYSLPAIGSLGDFYDGTNDPDYRNFQWSRSSDNSYFGIEITEGPTTNEVGYIYLTNSDRTHGHVFRSAHSNGFGEADIIVYSTLIFAPIDLDGFYTDVNLISGQIYTGPQGTTYYVSDQGLAAYTYGGSNFFNRFPSLYDFGTTGYRDGVFLGAVGDLDLRGDAYYRHDTSPATTTSPTGISIVKKQESSFFHIPCDENQFNSILRSASLINPSIISGFTNYKDAYPDP